GWRGGGVGDRLRCASTCHMIVSSFVVGGCGGGGHRTRPPFLCPAGGLRAVGVGGLVASQPGGDHRREGGDRLVVLLRGHRRRGRLGQGQPNRSGRPLTCADVLGDDRRATITRLAAVWRP